MDSQNDNETPTAKALPSSSGSVASGDNPPIRFGGHPTIFNWCSKDATRRRGRECVNLHSQNVERSRGFSRCDPRLVGLGGVRSSMCLDSAKEGFSSASIFCGEKSLRAQ